MSDSVKILAQVSPSANSLTTLYTVPANTSATVSSITICNQNPAAQIAFRVSIAVAGAADDVKQYIYYDLPLLNNDTFIATIGMTLAATDVIRVRSDTTNVSFNLFGIEIQ